MVFAIIILRVIVFSFCLSAGFGLANELQSPEESQRRHASEQALCGTEP
jgi:hypothetical protein